MTAPQPSPGNQQQGEHRQQKEPDEYILHRSDMEEFHASLSLAVGKEYADNVWAIIATRSRTSYNTPDRQPHPQREIDFEKFDKKLTRYVQDFATFSKREREETVEEIHEILVSCIQHPAPASEPIRKTSELPRIIPPLPTGDTKDLKVWKKYWEEHDRAIREDERMKENKRARMELLGDLQKFIDDADSREGCPQGTLGIAYLVRWMGGQGWDCD